MGLPDTTPHASLRRSASTSISAVRRQPPFALTATTVAYLLVGREDAPGWEHGGQGAVSVSRDFKNHFGFEAEISGQSHDDVQSRGLFALGALRYTAGPRLAFDAGARFGLNAEAPRVGLFAGMTIGVTHPSGH